MHMKPIRAYFQSYIGNKQIFWNSFFSLCRLCRVFGGGAARIFHIFYHMGRKIKELLCKSYGVDMAVWN